ncbi:MAG: DNA-binding protein [Bacteroidia bacterium]
MNSSYDIRAPFTIIDEETAKLFSPMEVICLESSAFYELVRQVMDKLMEQKKEKPKWISGEEAMSLLKITSKTTLQKLKNEGQIGFSQPMKKLVLYDRDSILSYLEKYAEKPFN